MHASKWHEESVVGGVMVWSEDERGPWPTEILALEPEHFDDCKLAKIWWAVAELIGGGHGCDLPAVAAKVEEHGHKGMASLLAELNNHGLACNLGHHAACVWDAGQSRLLKARLKDAVERSDGGIEDVAAGVADALRGAQRICGASGGLIHVREPLREALARIEMLSKNPDAMRFVKTGLKDLDRVLVLEESALTVVAGRPGMGKTAFAGLVARSASKNITKGSTCVFSLEMSAVAVVTRLIQGESKISKTDLGNPAVMPEMMSGINRLHGSDLYFDDRAGLTPTEMIEALRRQGRVRLVIVDYLQLAKTDASIERQDLRVGAITKALKGIAKTFRCHVLALAQLNRGVESRKPPVPMMSDLRDSGAIEEDADNVVFLYREDYYDKRTDRKGEADIIISKQRNGATDTVRAAWLPQYQIFADLDNRR